MRDSIRTFRCEVLTPTGLALEVQALSARIPLSDGSLGVLAGHAPLLAALNPGELAIRRADGTAGRYFVGDGFAHMRANVLSILASQCVAAEQVDGEAAIAELEHARSMPAGSQHDRDRRKRAMAAAAAKLRVAPRSWPSGQADLEDDV